MGIAKNFAESLAALLEGRADDVLPDHKAIAQQAIDMVTAHQGTAGKAASEKIAALEASVSELNAKLQGAENRAEAASKTERERAGGILKACSTAKLGADAALTQIEAGATIESASKAFVEQSAAGGSGLSPAADYNTSPDAGSASMKKAAAKVKAELNPAVK